MDDKLQLAMLAGAYAISKTDDKLRLAMMAGYYAIINNKKLEGSLYHNFENGDEISFHEAAKYLVCTANGLDPEKHEVKIGND